MRRAYLCLRGIAAMPGAMRMLMLMLMPAPMAAPKYEVRLALSRTSRVVSGGVGATSRRSTAMPRPTSSTLGFARSAEIRHFSCGSFVA